MSNQPFSAGDYDRYIVTTPESSTTIISPYRTTTGGTNSTWFDVSGYVTPSALEINVNIKFGGKDTNKIDGDLSRFTLVRRLRFLFDLLFKGKAIMEVEPKQIKLEKALEVLRNAK